jgi:hypothetical protein
LSNHVLAVERLLDGKCVIPVVGVVPCQFFSPGGN